MNKNVKSLLILLVALAVVLGGGYLAYSRFAKNAAPTELPTQADDGREALAAFTVYDASHGEVSYADWVGKPAVINFWASWCPPCCAELPDFQKAYEEYGEDVQFVMINLTDGERETEAVVQAFLEENGYTFPVYYDLRYHASEAYNITSIPQTLFVDKNGYVYTAHVGMLSESILNNAINTLLRE